VSVFSSQRPRIDAYAIKHALAGREAEVVERYRGPPNRALSNRRELRWGRQGSLSLKVDSGLWYDHELARGGDILEFLKHETGRDFGEVLALAAEVAKLSHPSRLVGMPIDNMPAPPRPKPQPEVDDAGELKRMDRALDIWADAKPIRSTIVEAYLLSRGIIVPDTGFADLGFVPRCPWEGGFVPAMVALLRDIITGEPCAIHRTALTPDARKIGRKVYGPKGGCAVKLVPETEVGDELAIAEGIETALSGRAFGFTPTWSVLDAGGMRTFPVLPLIRRLTVLADNDASGAGQAAGQACRERWEAAGKVVRVVTPTGIGTDFNDVLVEQGLPQ